MDAVQLMPDHVWKAAPGCRILVIDGGAVRLDFPGDWIAFPTARHIALIDRLPPATRFTVGVSWRRLSHAMAAVPLDYLLSEILIGEQREVIRRGDIHRTFRFPLEIAWIQLRLVEGCTRCTQAVILFDFQPNDELAVFDVWETLLSTLVVGDYIQDHVRGRRRESRG